jgi:hypothetical protein
MTKLQVWWIPKVPMEPFTVQVGSVAEGVRIMDVLADYDLFQLKHKVKGDFCNTGGIQTWVDDAGDGDPGWVDWYDEESGCDDPREFVAMAQEKNMPGIMPADDKG